MATKLRVTAVPSPKVLNENELTAFGNWIPNGDNKSYASDLAKRGLLNASELYNDAPNVASKKSIINSQSDWKPAAIQQILMRARMAGIKDTDTFLANKAYLSNLGNEGYKNALNHPEFIKIHPNFWQIASNIYKERLANEK